MATQHGVHGLYVVIAVKGDLHDPKLAEWRAVGTTTPAAAFATTVLTAAACTILLLLLLLNQGRQLSLEERVCRPNLGTTQKESPASGQRR